MSKGFNKILDFMKLNDKIINETMMNAFIFLRREAITNG